MLNIPIVNALKRSLIDDCVDRLRGGAVVLVDTKRLQHLIADEYNRSKLADGLAAWATPEVYTVSAWLGKLWRDHSNRSDQRVSTLLSSEQSRQIWERVISKSVRDEYSTGYEYLLWHITSTANQVRNAYELMRSYDIQPADFAGGASADAEHFQIWLDAYQKALTERNCIDRESLADHICKVAEKIFSSARPAVVFAGIDIWTPQLQRLIESINQAAGSVEILEHGTDRHAAQDQRFEFATTDEEIDACARWARVVVEANPEAHRVGIAVHSLGDVGPRLSRRLSDYLNPDAVLEERQTNKLPFHMTLGGRLSEVPIVVDAMNLLELVRPAVSVEVMASIVVSDRIKDWDVESAERARLAGEIFGVGGDRLSLDDVIALATRGSVRCPKLVSLLRIARKLLSNQPSTADYAYWGQFFMQWMETFQSAEKSGRPFGVDEWQAYRSWVDIVQSLAELGFVASKCRIETALAKLIRRVGESSVQPRAARVPIQVGEFLTMAGQSFTHLWLLGMNEKSVPGSPRPNPFLPISVQKKYGVPNSSAAVLNEQMRKRYDRIVSSAEHVVESYALMDGGDHHQQSNLLNHPQSADPKEWDEIAACTDYSSILEREFEHCVPLNDWQAPHLDLEEWTSGGTRLLKNQSNCPFRAFAEHRLHLQQPPDLEIGVTRLARGSLMHRVAESLYTAYTTPQALKSAFDSGELSQVVNDCVQSAVNEHSQNLVRPLSREVADVEVEILVNLANQLVEFDMKRTVEAIGVDVPKDRKPGPDPLKWIPYEIWDVEHPTEISLAGLTLRLKIDRIDAFHDQRILIDYKTGSCNAGQASGYRPKDPQLAAYAVAMHQQGCEIRDVAYIELKDGELSADSWELFVVNKRRNRNNSLTISDQFRSDLDSNWLTGLERLAADFIEGDAFADPLPNACQYCHITPVCRIKSKTADAGIENEVDIP